MVFPAIALVGSAVVNVAVSAHHAVQMNKLQRGFQKKLDNDAARIEYIKLMIARFKSVGIRLARTTRHAPRTKEFDLLLKKAMINDMFIRGYCEADIYHPGVGQPRNVWASIDRSGYIKHGRGLPRDVGPIWSEGCKSGHDEFSIAAATKIKGKRRYERLKTHKIDIGTMNLLLKFGTGFFMMIVGILMIRVQRAVIKEQQPFVVAKKKAAAKKKMATKKEAAAKKGKILVRKKPRQ